MSDSRPPPYVVARAAPHEQAEQLLASLRRRRKEAGDRLDAMHGMSLEKQQVATEYSKLDAEVRQVREALIPMRNRHLENTRTAFREPRRDAARRALAALAEAEGAINELDVMSGEMRRLGGHHPALQAGKIFAYLVRPLERLAREAS
jgi:hypothetical protein